MVGTVRIGALDGFATFFLAPLLGKLASVHPDLAIQLVTMPRIVSLSKREADIAISLAAPGAGRLHARRLTDYHLGLFASHAYLAEHPSIWTLEDLQRHRFIGYIEDMLYTPELDYLPLVSRDIRPSFSSSNLAVKFNAVCAGHGLCVLPVFMAVQEPRLVRVLAESVSLTRAFWLIVHSDMRDLARVRELHHAGNARFSGAISTVNAPVTLNRGVSHGNDRLDDRCADGDRHSERFHARRRIARGGGRSCHSDHQPAAAIILCTGGRYSGLASCKSPVIRQSASGGGHSILSTYRMVRRRSGRIIACRALWALHYVTGSTSELCNV